MLQSIRERITGVVAVFAIVLIGVPLVISFGQMDAGSAPGSFAARVNGEEIPVSEFRQVSQNQLLQQQQRIRNELPPLLRRQVQESVLESLIRNRVVSQFVNEQGYRIPDERIVEVIRSLPAFQVGGEFSNASYIATLASQGLTPQRFERLQRSSMKINQLQDGIVDSAFFTPSEFRRFIELERQRRDVAFVSFEAPSMADDIEVTTEEVERFYAGNPDRFRTDEEVTLEYVEISMADVGADIEVDSAAAREYYEANIDQFSTAEERSARHILIATDADRDDTAARKLAEELYEKLESGEAAFADLAREYSDDPGSAEGGGDLGWTGRGVYVEPFEAALFDLSRGEVSPPVQTRFGYHIIQLLDVRPGARQPFEAVRESLIEDLRANAAEEQFYALAERVDDLALENPGNLSVVAEGAGLELRRIERFTRSGGDPLGYSAALVEAAFSPAVLEDGENSPLVELSEDRAVVVRVEEHRPPRQKPLEDVREEVRELLQLEKATKLARERGEALLERLRADEDFETLATQYGVELQTVTRADRRSEDVPLELLNEIFRTVPPADESPVYRGVTLSAGYGVFRLDRVWPGRPGNIPRDQRDERKQNLAQREGRAAMAALVNDLRATAEVKVAANILEDPEEF